MPLVRMRADDLVELDGPSKILARAKDGTILMKRYRIPGPAEQGRLVVWSTHPQNVPHVFSYLSRRYD